MPKVESTKKIKQHANKSKKGLISKTPKSTPKNKQVKEPTTIPYVYGFQPPSRRKQIHALGYLTEPSIPKELSFNGFDPIKPCTSVDDWLAHTKEPAQSVSDFVAQCPYLSAKKPKHLVAMDFVAKGNTILEKYPDGKIYMLPLGDFDADEMKRFDLIIEYTELFLGIPVRKLPPVKLDLNSDDIYIIHDIEHMQRNATETEKLWSRCMDHNGSTHRQLCTSEELMCLMNYLPDDGLCLVALTNLDLYQTKADLFVSGIGAGYKGFAIFSLFRYNPNLEFSTEYWYDVTTDTTKYGQEECFRLILQRGCRLLVHEIGHLLGYKHCVYFNCCMNGSGHLQEDFSQPLHLRPIDLCKLQALTGVNITRRYEKLEELYDRNGLNTEAEWIRTRLKHIREADKQARIQMNQHILF